MTRPRLIWLRLVLVTALAAGPWQMVASSMDMPLEPAGSCHETDPRTDVPACCDTTVHDCAGGYLCQIGASAYSPENGWGLPARLAGGYDDMTIAVGDAPDPQPLVPPPTS